MGSKFIKKKKKSLGIPSFLHLRKIKKVFPNAKVSKKSWDSFEVVLEIQPTPLSEFYNVKICYIKGRLVKVFVIDKKLQIAKNRKKLPHVYNTERQQLCLYSPSKKEWVSSKYISETIIPWASEWLYYYELWLPEGKWYGGGHNEYLNEVNNKMLKNE